MSYRHKVLPLLFSFTTVNWTRKGALAKVTVRKLVSRKELNKACFQGGYIINIDPAGNVIHTADCIWISKMEPQKGEGGIYHSESYEEVVSWLKGRYSKVKECNSCLSGRKLTLWRLGDKEG